MLVAKRNFAEGHDHGQGVAHSSLQPTQPQGAPRFWSAASSTAAIVCRDREGREGEPFLIRQENQRACNCQGGSDRELLKGGRENQS